jgi:nucleoside-diphosphate-sugar epimerase
MRVAFIGGTRFIGHTAAAEAAFRGHDVTVLHRGGHPCELQGAHDVVVDRRDPTALARAVAAAKPDVVVDTWAMSKSDAEVTALVVSISGARAVVLSSQDVYAAWGPLLGLPAPDVREDELTERSPLMAARFPYRGKGHDGGEDYDKKDVEAVVRDAVTSGKVAGACVLRLPAVYGRRDYRRRFGAVVDALDAGEAIPCYAGAPFRWTHAHVRDVAHAIVLAAERATSAGFAVFNVGEAETPTMGERVDAIARAAARPLRWRETDEPLPEPFATLGRTAADAVLSSALVRAQLGFAEVTTAEERARDLVAWCRETRTQVARA